MGIASPVISPGCLVGIMKPLSTEEKYQETLGTGNIFPDSTFQYNYTLVTRRKATLM